MSLYPRRALAALVVLLAMGLPARAGAGLADDAHLFSHDARDKAVDAIEEIQHRTGKDLFIQTVNRLSSDDLKQYRTLKTEAERGQFFRRLAEQRASRTDVNGVYVLLCRVPADGEPRPGPFRTLQDMLNRLLPPQAVGLAVVVWPASDEAYFPPQDQAELSGKLREQLAIDPKHDKALLEAVAFVGERLEQHVRDLGAPPPDTFRWTSVLWAAAIIAAAWGFLSVARVRIAARQGTPGPLPGSAAPLAAQYGTAGALWLAQAYLARRRERVAAPAPAPEPEGVTDEGGMHPDDRAAIEAAPRAWDHEDAEAVGGHDAI
jgi:hypothetical protein